MRNTDNDWMEIGKNEPYFGVLANPKFLKKNLSDEILNEFYDSGQEDVNALISVFNRYFDKFQPKKALDFGCGVGRMTVPMAKYVPSVVGVDISEYMLNEARKNFERFSVNNIELFGSLPDNHFYDWINSLIVFQHIPPKRGYEILENLLRKINIGGFVSLHFTIFRDKNHLDEIYRDIECCMYDGDTIKVLSRKEQSLGDMTMYEYDLNQILSILVDNGLINVYMEHTNHGGCHGVKIFSKKVS
ncbi:MAG: class I SAM-dependent methyltransferase [Desulfovermiculus sp.]|nr:class I SAM-dependent methyltransferase [Desulfovermiculus sp.]